MPKGSYHCDKCVMVFTMHDALVRHQEAHTLSQNTAALPAETQEFKLQELKVSVSINRRES